MLQSVILTFDMSIPGLKEKREHGPSKAAVEAKDRQNERRREVFHNSLV